MAHVARQLDGAGRGLDPVLTGRLGLEQSLVGQPHQFSRDLLVVEARRAVRDVGGVRVFRMVALRDAQAYGLAHRLALGPELVFFEGLADPLGDLYRSLHARAGKDQGELVSAEAAGPVPILADVIAYHLGRLLYHLVPLQVVEGVVEELEVVDVDHDQGQGAAPFLSDLDLHVEVLVEIAAVVEACELVGHRQPLYLFLQDLPLGDVFDDRVVEQGFP